MKYFIGAAIALMIVLLGYQLIKKGDSKSTTKENVMVATQGGATPKHTAEILEVLQAPSYSYLRVKENGKELWLATLKEEMKVGDKYSYDEALEMTNFTSKELNRTFPVIYFVSNAGGMDAGAADQAAPMTMGKPKVEQGTDVVIPQNPGGISIGELYKNRSDYNGKKVRVKGKVVKVNPEVMDRNWVHLQDGTKDGENFDLTVTTLEKASVGDVLEFEGTIAVNKDFGAGYTYELIMESAVLKK